MIIGYQAVYDLTYFDAIDYASNNQFDFVSFDLNVPRFYVERIQQTQLEKIRDYSEKKGVKLAFHAPGDNISLFADYPSIRKGIMEHYTNIINIAEKLNARHITLHCGEYPSLKKSNTNQDDFISEYSDYYSKVLYENLIELCSHIKNMYLCVENSNFNELTMNTLKTTFKNAPLSLTWDIAKTYDRKLNLDIRVENFMYNHLDRIREVHVHDVKKDFRSHQTIGCGDINFKKYQSVFIQPEIAITIEVRPREEATISKNKLLEIIGEK